LWDVTVSSGHDPLHVVRREKFWDRYGAIEGSKKAVRFSLVGPEGKVKLGCFWRGRA
jgi:hypothetical protein